MRTLELGPTCTAVIADHPDAPVVGSARFVGSKSTIGLGECDLTVGGELIGTGTVRSYYIKAPGQLAGWPAPDGAMAAKIGLAARMAAGDPHRDGDAHVLPQGADPVLDNSINVVNGGIASAGLEVVAPAVVNTGRADDLLTTASLRVTCARSSGGQSRYVGTALRIGRRTGVADSHAIGSDGKVAIIARMTAYRC